MVEQEVVNCCAFSTGGDSLTIGTQKGFRIYQIQPVFQLINITDIVGGVKLVQSLG